MAAASGSLLCMPRRSFAPRASDVSHSASEARGMSVLWESCLSAWCLTMSGFLEKLFEDELWVNGKAMEEVRSAYSAMRSFMVGLDLSGV